MIIHEEFFEKDSRIAWVSYQGGEYQVHAYGASKAPLSVHKDRSIAIEQCNATAVNIVMGGMR